MDKIAQKGREEASRQVPQLDMDVEMINDISSLIAEGQRAMVENILADLHPADLAEVVGHIPTDEARQLVRWLPVEQAGEMIAELDDDFRARLLEETDEHRLTAILDELESDDAADVLADLPEEVAEKVLPKLEDAADVQELLAYAEDSAGGIMATEYVAVNSGWTVGEATEEIRRNADSVEDVFVVFVVDELDRFQGTASLKKLLLSPLSTKIKDILDEDVVTVTTDVDQEDVARLMRKYDLVSMPVLDSEGCLVGRITIDDVVDVIREEADEDIQRMSGVTGGEEATDTVLRIIRGRLPWLLAGLTGASLAAGVIWSFNSVLKQASILAGFIPIIMATAGNAGIQSSAITVQRLASGDPLASAFLRRLGKELKVALMNATAASLFLGIGIVFIAPLLMNGLEEPYMLAATAMTALLIVILQATILGTLIPLLLHRMGVDPALATGPFITTSNDIVGILVFFLLARILYL